MVYENLKCRERNLRIGIGITTLLLVFLGGAGASGTDSVTILSISPSIDTLLTEGQQVTFTVSGNYFLDSADDGEIRLYLQNFNDIQIFNSPVPTYSINRGNGTFTMTQTVIIPSMTQFWLITPLFPEGVEITNVTDARLYNVTNSNSAVTLTVSPSMVNLNIGGTQAFTATPKDQSGNSVSVEVTWASSNITVGTINNNGLFTALANGTTTVTANVGLISSADVTVSVGITLVDTYLPPGATPAERKAGLIRAMDDYFDNGTLTKAELLSVLDAYFA
jgi:hypothetical protein